MRCLNYAVKYDGGVVRSVADFTPQRGQEFAVVGETRLFVPPSRSELHIVTCAKHVADHGHGTMTTCQRPTVADLRV
jgi:hypothetical protein